MRRIYCEVTYYFRFGFDSGSCLFCERRRFLALASTTVWVYVISFSVILIVTTIVVTILFVKRYSSIACVALFCGITVLMAHHYTGLLSIISPDRVVKDFALKGRGDCAGDRQDGFIRERAF